MVGSTVTKTRAGKSDGRSRLASAAAVAGLVSHPGKGAIKAEYREELPS